MSGYLFYVKNILQIFYKRRFVGWGRKRTGRFAEFLAKKFKGSFSLYEDGFIRSVGLGLEGAKAFGMICDNSGIYYDATKTSDLENLLNSTNFSDEILKEARWCIEFIKEFGISKYNCASEIDKNFIKKYDLENNKNILIIAQTANDASLKYGLAESVSTDSIIKTAIEENPGANILLKAHPDVLSGKKVSSINLKNLDSNIKVITEDINPISLLKKISKVYTKTSGMGFEALLCGCECVCFGAPFYAGWGVSDDRVKIPARRTRKLSVEEIFAAAYLIYTKYKNPYTSEPTTLRELLPQILKLKERLKKEDKTIFLFGFSVWKRDFMKPFLNAKKAVFISTFSKNPLEDALKKGLDKNCLVYVWGKREIKNLKGWCDKNNINITRVEDGFIRSIGLGSDLTRPYSLVFDKVGMYFDTTQESGLENILNYHNFNKWELEEARELKNLLINTRISKYNSDKCAKIPPQNKKIALVIGQVEDDASVKIGADGMKNLELLTQASKNTKDSYIIYKPHPDVLSGNRIGAVENSEALKYCDYIASSVSLPILLDIADEIHTMTSTSGLEAILRGKKVVCYGKAFWAGWNLSCDKKEIPRRNRSVSVDELVAAAYVLYPKYIHPNTLEPCRAKDLILALQKQREELKNPLKLFLFKAHSIYARVGQKLLYFLKFMVRK
ncbi:MAG: capsular polysaccharide biosynthesis protein [Helicobacteraceae bacterium]|nr:capsular polysaccharide biosynthesis protein [Helicobacteraceae bacterium]